MKGRILPGSCTRDALETAVFGLYLQEEHLRCVPAHEHMAAVFETRDGLHDLEESANLSVSISSNRQAQHAERTHAASRH